ncbi:MAG: insulinase family protein [Bdellovibrionales bacterium]|nr:insulinase family protein [Bdellovibrionales bacterium]
MKHFFLIIHCLLVSATLYAQNIKVQDIKIPYEKHVLDNGLTVLLHEDHKAPIVAVNVWYHVGSKDEKEGKTGFAHLFEHLMFQGSENFNDEYIRGLEQIGATDINGTTFFDRTNYFQTVPRQQLDAALFLESDRMGHFEKAITQARLDEQRKVVKNEKRQNYQKPYGLVYEHLIQGSFPKGHPYGWLPIGSMEDLDRASLQDVKEWFKNNYGAANAVLVLAGDLDPKEALEKVKKYFGSIGPGPARSRPEQWIASRRESKRIIASDHVPMARLYLAWNVPGIRNEELSDLNLACEILAGGKTSRMYQKLLIEKQLVSSIGCSILALELSSILYLEANPKPGIDLKTIEKEIRSVLSDFTRKGPKKSELNLAKAEILSSQIRRLEKVGGMGGKAQILAYYETYFGNASMFQEALEEIENRTRKSVRAQSKKWLSSGDLALEVLPFPEYQPDSADANRSVFPVSQELTPATFPKIERARLSNGMEVILSKRGNSPLISTQLALKGGYAADPKGSEGLGKVMMSLMDEATKKRKLKELSMIKTKLGAQIHSSIAANEFHVHLSSLQSTFSESLDLMAEIALSPAFSHKDLTRIQGILSQGIIRAQGDPSSRAGRLQSMMSFPEGHPYHKASDGTLRPETLKAFTQHQIVSHYKHYFSPQNALFFAVGNISLSQLVEQLEHSFGAWKGEQVSPPSIAEIKAKTKEIQIYLSHVEGSTQTAISGAKLLSPIAPEQIPSSNMAAMIIGSAPMTNRINMNLREDKGWTYVAYARLRNIDQQSMVTLSTSVQKDKTAPAMKEIIKEFKGVSLKTKPITQKEFLTHRKNAVEKLGGLWESNAEILSRVQNSVLSGFADTFYATYPQKLIELKRSEVAQQASDLFSPQSFVFVLVGDLKEIEGPIRDLKLGQVHIVDEQGKILR